MTVKAESLLETSVQLRSLGWLGVDDHCPRDPTDISPVGMVAALHLDLAIHNFRIQEYMRHGDATKEVFVQSFGFEDGYLHPGDEPGLGVTLNGEAASKYPYQGAYLPVNRLHDGTINDW